MHFEGTPPEPVTGAEVARLFAHAPFGVALFDADLRFLYVNPHLSALNGAGVEAHLSRTPEEVFGPQTAVWTATAREVLRTGEPVAGRLIESTREGWAFEVSYFPVTGTDGTRLVATVRDVVAARSAQRRSQVVWSVVQAIAGAGSPAQIAEAVTTGLVGSVADRVSVAVRNEAGLHSLASAGYDDDALADEAIRYARSTGSGPVNEAFRRNDVVVVRSPEEFAERYPDWEPLRAKIGTEALIAVPLRLPDRERPDGVILAGWSDARRLSDEAADALSTIASVAGAALARVQLAETVQSDRFRLALDAMLDDVAIGRAVRDRDGEIVDFELVHVNARSVDGAGRTAAQLLGGRVLELYPAWRRSGLFDAFRRVVETGEPLRHDALHYVDEADGMTIEGWWRVLAVRFGDGYLATSRDVTEQVRAELELEAARIAQAGERQAVRLLQEIALPQRLPAVPGLELAAHYRAADRDVPIGGDWYDAFTLPGDRAGVVIGDVTGHGRAAAATMVRLRTLLATFAAGGESPSVVLGRVHGAVGDDLDALTTCAYALVDPVLGTLKLGRAGHLPPVLADDHGVRLLDVEPGLPVGVGPSGTYAELRVRLVGRATFVLFTDGLVERRHRGIDEGLDLLISEVAAHRDLAPDALVQHLVSAVGADEIGDDYCLIVGRLSALS